MIPNDLSSLRQILLVNGRPESSYRPLKQTLQKGVPEAGIAWRVGSRSNRPSLLGKRLGFFIDFRNRVRVLPAALLQNEGRCSKVRLVSGRIGRGL